MLFCGFKHRNEITNDTALLCKFKAGHGSSPAAEFKFKASLSYKITHMHMGGGQGDILVRSSDLCVYHDRTTPVGQTH